MDWKWHQEQAGSVPEQHAAIEIVDEVDDVIRLFPILPMDRCYPVVVLLARDRVEEAAVLVPDRAWVASSPLYG